MNRRPWWNGCLCVGCAVLANLIYLFALDPLCSVYAEPNGEQQPRVSVVVARDRAKLMHDVYSATLDVIHDRYFHGERATVPARALEDVFAEISRQSKIDARWISVNTRPMSIGHQPKDDFEKRAAKEIASGKSEYELIEGGLYRRAAPIRLTEGCVSCHVGFINDASKTPRYAGLVISMPIVE